MAFRNIGETVKKVREASGLSQWDFCDGVCAMQTLSNIENGKQGVSPIVFRSLMQKGGSSFLPYPEFADRDDFECFLDIHTVDFYLDSWQLKEAGEQLDRIEKRRFARNKLYYQEWLMLHCSRLLLSGYCDDEAVEKLIRSALDITGCRYTEDKRRIHPMLQAEIRLLIMLGEIRIRAGDRERSREILDLIEYQYRISGRELESHIPPLSVEIFRSSYLLAFEPEKLQAEDLEDALHRAVLHATNVPILRMTLLYVIYLYTTGKETEAEKKLRQLRAGSALAGAPCLRLARRFLASSSRFPKELANLFIPEREKSPFPLPELKNTAEMTDGAYDLQDGKCFTFGNMLEHLRIQQELSLNEVCGGLCTRSQLFKFENGTSVPKPLLADSLLQRLGITVQIFDFFCTAEETTYFRCRKQIILLDNKDPEKKAAYLREIEALSIAGETPVRQFLLYSKAMALSSTTEREAALQDALSVTIPSFDWTRHKTRLNWAEFYMVYHLIRCHYRMDPVRGIHEMRELFSTVEGYHFRLDQNRYYIPMMMFSLSSWYHNQRDYIALDALRPDYESPLMRYYMDFQVLYMYTHLCSLIRRDYRQYNLPAELEYTTGCLELVGEHDLSMYLNSLADNPQAE